MNQIIKDARELLDAINVNRQISKENIEYIRFEYIFEKMDALEESISAYEESCASQEEEQAIRLMADIPDPSNEQGYWDGEPYGN